MRSGRTRPVEGLDHFPRLTSELAARLTDADVEGDRLAEQGVGKRPESQGEERLQQLGMEATGPAQGSELTSGSPTERPTRPTSTSPRLVQANRGKAREACLKRGNA
jgi:hypothetical protein